MEGPENEFNLFCDNIALELKVWDLHNDGLANNEGNGVGLILISPDGEELSYALRLNFKTSNNEAEYEAFYMGCDYHNGWVSDV